MGSDESGFYVYPVFADGEGELMYAIGTTSCFGCCMTIIFNIKAFKDDAALIIVISYRSDVYFSNCYSQQRRPCSLHDADDHLLPFHRPLRHPDPLPKPVRGSCSVKRLQISKDVFTGIRLKNDVQSQNLLHTENHHVKLVILNEFGMFNAATAICYLTKDILHSECAGLFSYFVLYQLLIVRHQLMSH